MKQLGCLRFLLRQGLAIRGHTEDEGHLRQLLQLIREEGSSKIKINKEYLSPVVVNEQIRIIGHSILRELLTNIREAEYFAVLADETCDASQKEQLSVCIRWVDSNFTIHEDLIGFVHMIRTDADTLSKAIMDVLVRCSLPLSKCRGQGYDGAAAMMGHLRGVAARLRQEEPAALHVHCWAHCLNLCLQDVAKSCHLVRDSLCLVSEISHLIRNSPKRSAVFQKLKDQVSQDSPGLRPLCPTRWTVRTAAIQGALSNYQALVQTMTEISETCHDEYGTKAKGLLNQLEKFEVYFGLELSHTIFSSTEQLYVQQITIDEACTAANVVTKFLQHQREDATFSSFYERVQDTCKKLVGAEPRLPRYRVPPRRLDSGNAAHRYADPQAYYRRAYREAFDLVMNEMQRRFDQDTLQVPRNIEKTLIEAANWNGTEPQVQVSKQVAHLYQKDIDFDRLQRQLNMLSELVNVANENPRFNSGLKKVTSVRTVVDIMQETPGGKLMFGKIRKLAQILMTIPVSTATAERSFSALRRLKTYLRSTMTQQRLNSIALAHCHKQQLDNINMRHVAK